METRNSRNNQMCCPKCGSKVVPMSKGTGFRCAVPGNRWDSVRKTWTVCDGVIWPRRGGEQHRNEVKISRPADFPRIDKPTDEQTPIRDALALSPRTRGGRMLIIDAGPGTGKTSTLSWATRWIWQRLGSLMGYFFLAFNRNARDGLLAKLPAVVGEVYTLNAAGARMQGYNARSYAPGKLRALYRDLNSHLDPKDKTSFGIIGKVIERSRDLCLYNPDPSDSVWWGSAIDTVLRRFPGLKRNLTEKSLENVRTWVPQLAVMAHNAKGTIDIQEQITRPVTEAIASLGWKPEFDLVTKSAASWTDADIAMFAKLIKAIEITDLGGAIVDEAQDLSLAQIALFMAACWRKGELTIIGDDKCGQPDQEGYKAGQAIYGWRGAFPGSMKLIERLWEHLTGEKPIRKVLTLTHRCRPEIVAAFHELNTTARSARPAGGEVYMLNEDQAFERWLRANEGALWITRTNRPLARILRMTVREGVDCTIRGGAGFQAQLDAMLFPVAGAPDDNGEFPGSSLPQVVKALDAVVAEAENEQDSLEGFFCDIAKMLLAEPDIATKRGITGTITVGKVRQFILDLTDKASKRVLTTVYRCKGDEAETVIVDDTANFNAAWNGDADEAAACRHVALSRARENLYATGPLDGGNLPLPPADELVGDVDQDIAQKERMELLGEAEEELRYMVAPTDDLPPDDGMPF